MTQRLCPRCHSVVVFEDNGTLTFCSTCGAPQVRLSEELLHQAEQRHVQRDAAGLSSPASNPPSDPSAILWRIAIQTAGLAAAIAAALALLSVVLPPVALFSWIWAIAAPMLALRLYLTRSPGTRVYAGFGARLGLLTALAIALANITFNTLTLLLMRFALHAAAPVDSQINNLFTQFGTQWTAQVAQMNTQATSASAIPPDFVARFLALLSVPEYRVGFLLFFASICLVVYLLYAALTGGLAGLLRSRATRPLPR